MVCVRPSRGGGRAPENWASAVRRPLGHFEAVRRGHSLSSAQDSRSGAAAPRAEARRRFWALTGGGQGARPRALRVPRHGARPGRDHGSCIGGQCPGQGIPDARAASPGKLVFGPSEVG